MEADITEADAARVTRIFFEQISEALAIGDRVEIRGLCSFYVKEYGGYTRRNPRTQQRAEVGPKKLPVFKPGKELKERVDYQLSDKNQRGK